MMATDVEPWVRGLRSWTALAQLVEEIRNGNVVPFLGAGVSCSIGFKDWKGLVLALGEAKGDKLGHLDQDPVFLADRFRQRLSDQEYADFLRSTFACDAAVRKSIQNSSLLQALAVLPFNTWVTLNYDCAMEYALAEAGRNALSVDWADRGSLSPVLLAQPRADSPPVCVHLHGLVPGAGIDAATFPGNIVLTEQDYQHRYLRSDEDRSKLFVLLTSRTVLFIGCSLTDVDLMGVLREVKAKLGYRQPRHFAFLPAPAEDAEMESQRQRLAVKYGVEAIFFDPKDRFAGLPELLRYLKSPDDPMQVSWAGSVKDDPQKGRWGLSPLRGPFRLSAKGKSGSGRNWFRIEVVVDGPGERAVFHLHPTFPNQRVEVPFKAQTAVLPLAGWGAFTVGAEVIAGSRTIPLELDLADCEDLPQEFREA